MRNMDMFPPDENDFSEEVPLEACNFCGAPGEMVCHPNCRIGKGEVPDVMSFVANNIMRAMDDYFEYYGQKKAFEYEVDKVQETIDNWTELGRFIEVMHDAGVLQTAEDVIRAMKFPKLYKQPYMIWVEFKKPNKTSKEFSVFQREVLNRKT